MITAYNVTTDEKLTFDHDDVNLAFDFIINRSNQTGEPLAVDPQFNKPDIIKGKYHYQCGDWSIKIK
jgi:hypothetical protein